MSMGYVSFFSRDMIAGRGWIGMAAESMGLGIPWKIACSVLIFGMADSLAVRLQMLNLPSQLIQTIPYVVTMIDDWNLFEEKYVGKEEELMELFRNSELL